MPTRSWRRLAGCIAISCVGALAADYRAGAAASGHVRAVVIEDRRGARAVFAEADFPITRAVSDFAAVQLLKAHNLDREGVVISGAGDAQPEAIVPVIQQALAHIEDANLSGALSIRTAKGTCVASLYPIRLGECREGAPVRGPIHAAFQMIDVPHPLQTRDAAAQAYPIQAVAIGKVVILALGGEVPPGRYPGIVVTHANDTHPLPDNSAIESAIAAILKRVR